MIKLKDLITEGKRPTISKMDEGRALQVIITKLLPGVVNLYNFTAKYKWNIPQITLDVAKKYLFKIKKELYTNGEEIIYAVKIPGNIGTTMEFTIQKLSFRDEEGDETGENRQNVFEVGFYDFSNTGWGNLAWTKYDVEGLARGDYDTVSAGKSYVDPTS